MMMRWRRSILWELASSSLELIGVIACFRRSMVNQHRAHLPQLKRTDQRPDHI